MTNPEEDILDKIINLCYDCGSPSFNRTVIDDLIGQKTLEGHSNHCAMRQVLENSKCICNIKGE